jgi:DNA repair exonuclease SbcCD ATPase subunit
MHKTKDSGKFAGIICGIAVLLVFIPALAQSNAGNTPPVPATKQKLQEIEQRRIQAIKNFATTTAKQRLEAVEQKNTQAAEKIKALREQVQEKIKNVREKVQQKITEIRDKQKQRQTQQIIKQLEHLNQVWIDHLTKLLNHYDAVLEKIKTRTDKAAANGNDVSAADAAIQAAKTAILSGRTAVETQAKKTYMPDLTAVNSGVASSTTPTGQNQMIKNLRDQFKTLKEQLQKDLFDLRDGAIKNARTAVQNALQALSKVPKVDEEPAATSTPSS